MLAENLMVPEALDRDRLDVSGAYEPVAAFDMSVRCHQLKAGLLVDD
jgi:hypothetical protein